MPRPATPAAEDCLKTVYAAGEWSDEKITLSRLAQTLGVSPSTASEAVRKLTDAGLLRHERYGGVELTDAGREQALGVVRRHRLIETFLVADLGYSWDEVHEEAEVLEHAVSDRLLDRLDRRLGHPERDPHGDPIPRSDGTVPRPGAHNLADLPEGAAGSVARISDADPEVLRYFADLGIGLDEHVRVVKRREFAGTTVVRLGEGERARDVDLGDPAVAAIWVLPAR
ncbi:metal-dependent transcriptional regulator [Kineococcus sp. SYSU DK005]|uniref:metal-dependent transcriptional regulator n=1 Tax=Kineococcus sp. SYSU DK005 TaxID=3383126 RepID=UPI003D7C9FC8